MKRRRGRQAIAGWWRRSACTAAVITLTMLTVAGATVASAEAPASASPLPVGNCTATSGVIVAVDFGHWGGPIVRSCDSTPTTGFSLLNEGGWRTAGTQHDGPGFVCRIGYDGYRNGTQYPTPSQEPCILTPPAGAYWTFWQASPGQHTWTYSQAGAMSYHPAPGSVSLWVFGGTNIAGTAGSALPPISPDAVRARTNAGSAQAGTPAIVNASATVLTPVTSAESVNHGSPGPAILTLAIVLVLAAGGITAVRRRSGRQRGAE
jgi:hypothetical protein